MFSAPELANKQLGVCAGAVKTCNGTEWVEPDYAVYSADYESVETACDELDNDCDGVVDTVTDVLPDETEFVCWGNGLVHQPRLVDEGSWADVALNVNGSLGCGLDTEGRLLCWGKGQWYDDSAGFVPGTLAPRELIAGSRWRDIMLTQGPDGDTVLGILEDGTLALSLIHI